MSDYDVDDSAIPELPQPMDISNRPTLSILPTTKHNPPSPKKKKRVAARRPNPKLDATVLLEGFDELRTHAATLEFNKSPVHGDSHHGHV
jgi:hypothetical protein